MIEAHVPARLDKTHPLKFAGISVTSSALAAYVGAAFALLDLAGVIVWSVALLANSQSTWDVVACLTITAVSIVFIWLSWRGYRRAQLFIEGWLRQRAKRRN